MGSHPDGYESRSHSPRFTKPERLYQYDCNEAFVKTTSVVHQAQPATQPRSGPVLAQRCQMALRSEGPLSTLSRRSRWRRRRTGTGAWAGIAIDGSEGPLWDRERSQGPDIKRHRNTRQLTRQCHRGEPFAGRLPYQARRDRIALSCKSLRWHIHLRGSLVSCQPCAGPDRDPARREADL